MKIMLIIYLISVVLGLLGEFFLHCIAKTTIKKYYKKINKTPLLLRFSGDLKLLIMPLIPLYNILLFIGGLTYTEEQCIATIEKSKDYVRKEWGNSFFYFYLNTALKCWDNIAKKLTKEIFQKFFKKSIDK